MNSCPGPLEGQHAQRRRAPRQREGSRRRRAGARSSSPSTARSPPTPSACVDELLAAALGGLGVRVSGPAAAPPAERIDTAPLRSCPRSRRARCPPTIRRRRSPRRWTRSRGRSAPARRASPERRPRGRPGAGHRGIREGDPESRRQRRAVRLVLDSVKATGGQELLRPEACGRERNPQPAAFKSWGSHRLKATKTVRLIAGADPRALQSVSGRVQCACPRGRKSSAWTTRSPARRSRSTARSSPSPGWTGGTVSYQIAGARDRVLLFRALNSKGQPLASPSSFSSDFHVRRRRVRAEELSRGSSIVSRLSSPPTEERWSCRSR